MVEAISTTATAAAAPSGGGGGALLAGFILLVLFGLVIIGIIIYVIYMISKYMKHRDDLMFKVRKERLKLCRAHRSYESKHWFKAEKNTPIRLMTYEWNNGRPQPKLSRPVAYHRGDFYSNDGNLFMSIFVPGNRDFFILPRFELLVINNKPERNVTIGKKTFNFNLPTAKDLVQYQRHPDEIILHADGISDVGDIYVPVIRDDNGDPIDMAAFALESMKDVGMSYLFSEHLNTWANANKKAVDTNPYVRIANKTSDSNMSVEQQNIGRM